MSKLTPDLDVHGNSSEKNTTRPTRRGFLGRMGVAASIIPFARPSGPEVNVVRRQAHGLVVDEFVLQVGGEVPARFVGKLCATRLMPDGGGLFTVSHGPTADALAMVERDQSMWAKLGEPGPDWSNFERESLAKFGQVTTLGPGRMA